MTPEKVFAYARTYQWYYRNKLDPKFIGKLKIPPLIQQRDRQFYYRIAHHLTDDAIHALFTVNFFHTPTAYISDLVSNEKFTEAVAFASRAQNGRPLFEAELYELAKRFQQDDVHTWLYENTIPACLQEVMCREFPLDLACLILLIPQPHLHYDWPTYWANHPDASLGLGAQSWIDRLKKTDRLLWMHLSGWRVLSHDLAKEFWAGIGIPNLAPQQKDQTELFS
jgi:hypothetical protein